MEQLKHLTWAMDVLHSCIDWLGGGVMGYDSQCGAGSGKGLEGEGHSLFRRLRRRRTGFFFRFSYLCLHPVPITQQNGSRAWLVPLGLVSRVITLFVVPLSYIILFALMSHANPYARSYLTSSKDRQNRHSDNKSGEMASESNRSAETQVSYDDTLYSPLNLES
ncbi:hypothetical protein J437_LFUL008177, partial [Ladona fulva]